MRHLAIILAATALPAYAQESSEPFDYGEKNVPEFEPTFDAQTRAPVVTSDVALEVEEFAGGLTHPWAIEELPGENGFLVTERSGALRHVTEDGVVSDPIAGVPEVHAVEQGGLLDVELGPNFEQDRMIYLTYAKPLGDGMSATAAGRGMLSEEMTSLEDFTEIFVQEPPSPTPMHYGSRIVFDGEGHAFITTGEHFTEEEREYAQDLDNTYGKVVRINLDGSTPEDNPFVGQEGAIDTIWSYGHRNIQSAAYHDGTLWTIEHGPAGGDEVNRTEAGQNYGWPVVSYGEQYSGEPVGIGEPRAEGFAEPVYYWDPVIAPGDMAIYEGEMFPEWEGDILVGGLVASGLVRLAMEEGEVTGEERLLSGIGRTREVEVLDDGALMLAIDDPDGRLLRVTAGGSAD